MFTSRLALRRLSRLSHDLPGPRAHQRVHATRQIHQRAFAACRPYRPVLKQATSSRQWMIRSKHSIPFTGSAVENAKILFRHYPFAVSLASAFILAGIVVLVMFNYWFFKYHVPAYHNFPESVAKHLRRAIYYTNIDLDPQKATEYYGKALEAAREAKMDPYGDEVIGIRLQLAYLLEKSNSPKGAIKIFEAARADLLVRSEEALTLPQLDSEQQQQRRTRLLAKSIAIALKLGEMYSSPYVANDTAALEILLWAVNTVLRENRSRESKGATDETHGKWLTQDEFGATLESLAHSYEESNAHFLAAPLFLQALAAKSTTDCHSIVLMNNLSISLAQQRPPAERGAPPANREALVQSAKEWAEKALRVAGEIKPPLRNEECDVGCAVALHNLGEFAEMLGDKREARQRYQEAVSLARAVKFEDGVERSSAMLRKLQKEDAISNN